MDEDTALLKFRDLVERTGLPEADVRRILRTYGEFFTSRKQGRIRLYPPEVTDRLKQIAELEAVGTTATTIRGCLRGQGCAEVQADPAAAVVPGGFPPAAGETLTLGALSDIKALQLEAGELRAEIASLRERLAEHEQRIIGHQQQIRLLRHDVDEQKTEVLARRVEQRSIPFWRRLFPGKDVPRR
jgi:DNA-binding transcriptional MerR regulator